MGSGQFDIGSWFRPFHIDYHIPVTATTFSVPSTSPLFYLELLTNKKVQFKRFIPSPVLNHLKHEVTKSPFRYAPFKPLTDRYEMAKKAKLREQVMAEIQKSLVE
jgi:hypothetical protein